MNKVFVLSSAAIFFVYGVLFLFIPMETFEFVVDGTVNSSSGITDVRASYGGMSVGIGIILYLLGKNENTMGLGLASVGVVMLGMATGRSIGIVVDGNANAYMYIYLTLEVIVCFVAFALFNANKKG